MTKDKTSTFEAFEADLMDSVPALHEHEQSGKRASEFVDGLRAALRSERQARKIRQADVAKQMGVTPSYVTKLETGRSELSLYWFARYCDAIGLNAGAMAGRAWLQAGYENVPARALHATQGTVPAAQADIPGDLQIQLQNMETQLQHSIHTFFAQAIDTLPDAKNATVKRRKQRDRA